MPTHYYCTNNTAELLKLIGVTYKSDYNGRSELVFSSSDKDKKLIVLGNKNASFDNFDPHDLWHDRLSLVISRRKVNPMDMSISPIAIFYRGIFFQKKMRKKCGKNAGKCGKNAEKCGKNSSNIEKSRRYRHRGEGNRWRKKKHKSPAGANLQQKNTKVI